MNLTIKEHIKNKFIADFKNEPLLIFSPGRINLIGEHTDYNQGFVFPVAINKGIYAAISKTNDYVSTVHALDAGESFQFQLDNISPISENSWKNYVLGVVNEIQKTGKQLSNFNIIFSGDIPSGAGLSSSAALENAITFGLNELFNLNLTKKEMIYISQKAEHNFVGVQCGIMDQFASMFGKENKALLLDCSDLNHKEFPIQLNDVEIVLINSNVKHSLAESAYNERRSTCEHIASLIKVNSLREVSRKQLESIKEYVSPEDYKKAQYVIEENQRVLLASEALKTGDIQTLGNLLYESHGGLSNQYQVSCEELDFLVEKAKESSAVIGARMMGGGFGGCTLNLIRSSEKNDFLKTIQQQYKLKFNKQCSVYKVTTANGTQII